MLPPPRLPTPTVKRSARWSLVFLLLPLALAAPSADAETEDYLHRWVPAFAVFFDMLGQKAEGEIATSDVLGPPLGQGGCTITDLFGNTTQNGTLCPDSPFALAPPTGSDDTSVAPLVGASLELATPRLIDAFFSPRLFAHVDGAAAFGFERNLAGQGKPGPFFTDPLKPSDFEIFELSVNGQGSRAKLQVRPFVFSAGAGVAFTTTLFQRTLRFKPSVEYLYEEVDLIASVRRAVKQVDPAGDLGDFRLIALQASEKEALHGVGGGVEVEGDAGRLGPFVLSVYLGGRGYRFTGNLKHTLRDSNEFGEWATWRFELDPWAWRAGVGARFRWSPEE
jgi:hypothetical protein